MTFLAGTMLMSRTIAAVAAALQIGIGILLLVGTAGLAGTAYRTVREESGQLAENLVAAAEALESARGTYAQSATNLFVLTGSMEDVGDKLDAVSGKITGTGNLFSNQATKCEEFARHLKWTVFKQEISIAKPFLSLAEWCRNSGRQFSEIGDDVASIATALHGQGKTIEGYRDEGHGKTLVLMATTEESLRHAERLLDGGRSAGKWCGFVCVLGFCVSMLFIANGALLLLFSKKDRNAAHSGMSI